MFGDVVISAAVAGLLTGVIAYLHIAGLYSELMTPIAYGIVAAIVVAISMVAVDYWNKSSKP